MKLSEMPAWQIITIAVGVLIVGATGAYFGVTRLTSTKSQTPAQSTIPADLNNSRNKKVVDDLGKFTAPRDLPVTSGPLRTPNPNAPSFPNPFSQQ